MYQRKHGVSTGEKMWSGCRLKYRYCNLSGDGRKLSFQSSQTTTQIGVFSSHGRHIGIRARGVPGGSRIHGRQVVNPLRCGPRRKGEVTLVGGPESTADVVASKDVRANIPAPLYECAGFGVHRTKSKYAQFPSPGRQTSFHELHTRL